MLLHLLSRTLYVLHALSHWNPSYLAMTGPIVFSIRLLSICHLSAHLLLLILCLLFLLLVAISLVPAPVISKKIKMSSVSLLLSIVVLSPNPAPGRVQPPTRRKRKARSLPSISKPVLVPRRMPIQAKMCPMRYYSLLADLSPHNDL